MDFNEQIKEVIQTIVTSFEEETIQNNQESYDILEELYRTRPNDFLDVVRSAYQDFNILTEQVVNLPQTGKESILQYIVSGLYEHYHETRIEKLEGSSCCADKSSFVVRKTLQALKTGQNQSLFADYTKVDHIKEDKERQAYWSPTTVKDTDEAIDLFWKWYQQIE